MSSEKRHLIKLIETLISHLDELKGDLEYLRKEIVFSIPTAKSEVKESLPVFSPFILKRGGEGEGKTEEKKEG